MEEPVKVSVHMTSVGDKPSFRFTPVVTKDNFNYHFSNLMNNTFNAYNALFGHTNMLRPVSQEEKDLNIYVFKTNDEKDEEHSLFKARRFLYEESKKAFDMLLTQVFPDVIYIEKCKEFQQTISFDDPKFGEHYKEEVEKLTNDIREHYSDLISNLVKSVN